MLINKYQLTIFPTRTLCVAVIDPEYQNVKPYIMGKKVSNIKWKNNVRRQPMTTNACFVCY